MSEAQPGTQVPTVAADNVIQIQHGGFLFDFESFDEWRDKAPHYFRHSCFRGDETLCVDTKGRLCRVGKQFMRARDENAFPIRVYRQVCE